MAYETPDNKKTWAVVAAIVALVFAAIAWLVFRPGGNGAAEGPGGITLARMPGDANSIIRNRQLSPEDVLAALTTYMPSGKHDEYLMFASGGHSGQMLVVGVPSMRLLKVIGVFTPEPWQGWGYSSETREVLNGGGIDGSELTWGDTHHPALSETDGEYDGQFLFINDKASARLAVIDLRDFETKQLVKNPLAINDHGGAFVTPDTEWIIEGGQYAHPVGGKYASIADYKKAYRGLVTCWKFDRAKGRVDSSKSFAIELPPYWQDLADAGKRVSEGWIFLNSFNTEMASGGGHKKDGTWFEAGASQRDMDYLHAINLKKAAAVAAAGKASTVNGFKMITLQTAVSENILYFAPEPKSPHGVDVTPGGEFMVVSGKLDPHVTVYSFKKMMDAIQNKAFSGKDSYGVPILDFKKVVEKQVELGLGPLHTQFDAQGYAYTSLFLDSAVARWSLGGPYEKLHKDEPWTLVKKIPVHYNVGHVAAAEGDTASPDGRFLVALDKWSVDRFANVGPLLPQNLQLIDISNPGDKMQLLYDMPIGIGEPHYAQIIKADKIKAWEVYPEIGWSPVTQAKSAKSVMIGKERVVRNGNNVEIFMSAVRSHFNPEHIEVNKGDRVVWHITNVERAKDATHGFALFNYNLSLEPGETETLTFTASREGVYPFYCTEFCSALHLEMVGYLLVKP